MAWGIRPSFPWTSPPPRPLAGKGKPTQGNGLRAPGGQDANDFPPHPANIC